MYFFNTMRSIPWASLRTPYRKKVPGRAAGIRFFALALLLWCGRQPAFAADLGFSCTLDKSSYGPGDSITLCLDVSIPPGWHLFGNPLGPGIGIPLMLGIRDSLSAITWSGLSKTAARKFFQHEIEKNKWVWAYEKEARFFFSGVLAPNAAGMIRGTISVNGLFCSTSCVRVAERVSFAVPATGASKGARFANAPNPRTNAEPMALASFQAGGQNVPASLGRLRIQAAESPQWRFSPQEPRSGLNLLLALFFAFIAGVILNVMPCVLPVLGIKILAFSRDASEPRHAAVVRSIAFSAGMLSLFLALASLAAFARFSWGQQFQNPAMLAGIVCVIFLFALGMFDCYPIFTPSALGAAVHKTGTGFTGDFLGGMFAALLATPCSGPFLGATLAWTLTQPVLVIYAVFIALGAGMASPYVLLSASSTIRKLIPKPGRWMNDFKHVLGFLLLGFAVYLLGGLQKNMMAATAGMCVALALGVGIYKRFAPFGSSRRRRLAAAGAVFAVAAAGIYLTFFLFREQVQERKSPAAAALQWTAFQPQLLRDAQAAGRNAVVDFTATWCLNCQYNTAAVLNSKSVSSLLEKKKVLSLVVDMTGTNPEGEALLHALGSRSIPFFAVFPAGDPQRPIIMRDVLDRKRVCRVLEKLPDR